MHEFHIQNDALYCEECRVADIAREVGTPAYIYSAKTIIDHFTKIRDAFGDSATRICYSVKANSNIHILSLLKAKGAGADIVSGGELFRCLQAGIRPEKIVFSGAGKTDAEIEYALNSGIDFFNVESIPELRRISEIGGRLGQTAKICVRVNPDIDPGTHAFTATGKKETKFGLSVSDIESHYRIASELPGIQIHGIDVHLGSPILKIDPYLRALEVLGDAVQRLRRNGVRLRVLDLGGGLGIVYREEDPLTAQAFAAAVLPPIRAMGLELIVEPGRFIVGNAGVLAARVTFVKQTAGKTFVIVDAGMNDLIRPPLYGSYHEIKVAEQTGRPSALKADVVGPICESSDFLAKDRQLPDVKQGEFVAVMSAGAYGFSMSSNYNSRPRACEVLVEGAAFRLIRRRETYETLVQEELPLLAPKGSKQPVKKKREG